MGCRGTNFCDATTYNEYQQHNKAAYCEAIAALRPAYCEAIAGAPTNKQLFLFRRLFFAKFDDIDGNGNDAGIYHIEQVGGAIREIDDAPFNEGSTVIDANDDRFIIILICYDNDRTEWKFFVSGAHAIHIEDFA